MLDKFRDKEWSARVNRLLVEIEQLDPEQKITIQAILDGIHEGTRKKMGEQKAERRKRFSIVK